MSTLLRPTYCRRSSDPVPHRSARSDWSSPRVQCDIPLKDPPGLWSTCPVTVGTSGLSGTTAPGPEARSQAAPSQWHGAGSSGLAPRVPPQAVGMVGPPASWWRGPNAGTLTPATCHVVECTERRELPTREGSTSRPRRPSLSQCGLPRAHEVGFFWKKSG
jgi:hypothetical protein